jgi:hypothetical protein
MSLAMASPPPVEKTYVISCTRCDVKSQVHTSSCCGRRKGRKKEQTWQHGQTKPLMFSTTPSTGSPIFLQKLISFRTSDSDTPWTRCQHKEVRAPDFVQWTGGRFGRTCGVVTITAPSGLNEPRYCVTEMCSSEVPARRDANNQKLRVKKSKRRGERERARARAHPVACRSRGSPDLPNRRPRGTV